MNKRESDKRERYVQLCGERLSGKKKKKGRKKEKKKHEKVGGPGLSAGAVADDQQLELGHRVRHGRG